MKTYPWHNEKVKSILDIDYFYRTQPGGPNVCTKVSLSQLTGTHFKEYSGGTWLEMYNSLARANPESREEYINYYHPKTPPEKMILHKYGSDYLINGGNNRLCTWRFAGKESIHVKVCEFAFDEELHKAWQELTTLHHIVTVRCDEAEEYPKGIWKLKLGEVTVDCEGRERVLAFAQAYKNLSVQGGGWLWLRLTYKYQLKYLLLIGGGEKALSWQVGVTSLGPTQRHLYPSYMLAFKMQQQLLYPTSNPLGARISG